MKSKITIKDLLPNLNLLLDSVECMDDLIRDLDLLDTQEYLDWLDKLNEISVR